MELFLDVLGESLVDTAKMLPFLFLAYLLIEYIAGRRRALGRDSGRGAGLCAAVRLFGHCVQLLLLPRHHAGHPDGRLPCHQRRSHPAAGIHAGLLG